MKETFLGFIEVPFQREPVWVEGEYAIKYPPNDDYNFGFLDCYYQGDHAYYTVLPVKNENDLRDLLQYTGHHFFEVRIVAQKKLNDLFPNHLTKQKEKVTAPTFPINENLRPTKILGAIEISDKQAPKWLEPEEIPDEVINYDCGSDYHLTYIIRDEKDLRDLCRYSNHHQTNLKDLVEKKRNDLFPNPYKIHDVAHFPALLETLTSQQAKNLLTSCRLYENRFRQDINDPDFIWIDDLKERVRYLLTYLLTKSFQG